MEVLIGILLFLVLGIIVVLVSRDSERKIRDLASDMRMLDGKLTLAIWGNENEPGLKNTVSALEEMVKDLSFNLTSRLEALETGKVNAGEVNECVGVAINLAKEELRAEIVEKANLSALDTLTNSFNSLSGEIKSLREKIKEVVETLNIAVREARHKAEIYEPYELAAKEYKVTEDGAQAMIKCVEDDSMFSVAALQAGIKLADIAGVQAKVRELIAPKAEVEKEEK